MLAFEAKDSRGPAVDAPPPDLKGKAARGALVSTVAQVTIFFLRTGSMVVLARVLSPADFGIVGMVTACTGLFELFRDMGLSVATIQKASITRAQTSTLFWINLAAGLVLSSLCAASAPLITCFYHEPRLFWPTIALGAGFILNGAAVQHRAILARDMRFAALAVIDIASVVGSIAVGIAMAAAHHGYWALVGMYIALPFLGLLGVLAIGGWVPGPPRRGAGIRSMLHYGGTLTLKNLVLYLAFNTDKVLLGRFCGAEALGIYGRAYQLISLPTQNLTSTIGQVAVPALSRVQNHPESLRSYFLKSYAVFLSLVMPITMVCALFSEDIVTVFLGSKWGGAVPLFRLLSPTVFTLALVNPLTWLLLAIGRPGRSLRIALVTSPVVIAGYVIGLGAGPGGVAAGFSVATLLLTVPTIVWATCGTVVTAVDILKAVARPFFSVVGAAAATWAVWGSISLLAAPLLRLTASGTLFLGVYAFLLIFVMGEKNLYFVLLRQIGIWPGCKMRQERESHEHSGA
jgi:O-antigen/teichoic acid export membrane protein